MRRSLLALLMMSFFPTTGFSEFFLYSRNMPTSCEYVFNVESDIRIELPSDLDEERIMFSYVNTWAPYLWTSPEELPVAINQSGTKKFSQWSLTSMSLPQNHLYRVVKVFFPKSKILCQGEFGREFGEACMPGGREVTPWRSRVFNCKASDSI